jgi:methylated-DNA-[protein]-cysteine S-methyltransferase
MYVVQINNKHIGDVFPVFDENHKLTEICLMRPAEFNFEPVKPENREICTYLENYPDGVCPLKFEELILNDRGDFHLTVYKNLFNFPKGEVITYGKLAEKCGSKSAARSVGTAMAQNPYPLIIPCHRVIRSGGELGNYSSGVHKKEILLKAEGANWK